jgi:ElaB/YqjD/DUF883 family membrane-anchored ribosome-binding protein
MTMTIDSAKEAIAERVNPALESFEERLEEKARGARRAITHGRYAAEDIAAEATLQVRRRPLTSVILAAAAGTVAGCLVGFVLGWQAHHRTS